MDRLSEPISSCSVSFTNAKISALESSLHLSLNYCQDLTKHFDDLAIEANKNRNLYRTLKEKCESKLCSSSEELKKDIESKNNIIQSVITTLTNLCETKNFNILNDVFVILCGKIPVSIPKLEPVKDICKVKKEDVTSKNEFLTPKKELCSPKKEVFTPIPDLSLKEESISEIEGTPTGRTSPILKLRNTTNSPDLRNKKKCPKNWPTPEHKSVKLTFPSPTTSSKTGTGVRLRQKRLDLIKPKTNNFIDLTSSPELMAMNRNSQKGNVQPLVKKESTDNDDTILPSPTSGPNNFSSLCKATSMISPIKFKKPPLCFKSKSEITTPIAICDLENTPVKGDTSNLNNQTEDSINLLKPVRIINEHTPIKIKPVDNDETHCEIPSSLSILENVDIMLDEKQDHVECQKNISPSKMPLAENKNLTNVPPADTDSSMSILCPIKVSPTEDKIKRQLSCKRPPAPIEPLYKEQLPRSKVEKRKLPGWNCDECKNFYDELYKDDPEMLAKKMDDCSKHRGRNNPARPKTPEGFWNPRWSVPTDTEEFNKRNNVS